MALIGNYSALNGTVYRQFTGGIASGYVGCTVPNSALKNRFFGAFDKTSATFNGYLHPMAYVMPMRAGGMASNVQANGTIQSILAQLFAGRNAEASSTSQIIVTNARADLIIAMIADAILAITTFVAGLSAAVSGSGSSTMTLATISAQLGGIFDVSASGQMTLNVSTAMTALANMIAEAGGATPLSPEGLAEAVWNYLKANPTTTGSMKEVLEKAKLSADNAFAVSS